MSPVWRIGLLALLALLALTATPRKAAADRLAELGAYERLAVQTALATRELRVDEHPDGKRLHRIHVVNLEVFSEDAGVLQHLNALHRSTREYITAREVLLRPGDVWDEEIVRETARELLDPFLTQLVVVLPVESEFPDTVDLLVVTRDVWSLRTNSEFENQAGRFTKLLLAASENNFLGHRKRVAFVFDMEQGDFSLGPLYEDPNLAGSRARLTLWPRLLYNRETRDFEGTQSWALMEYPLWALDREWAGKLEAIHKDSVVRVFQGADVATYDNPATPQVEQVPIEYRMFDGLLATEVTRATGEKVKYHFTLGHELAIRRPILVPDLDVDDDLAQAFIRDELPRNELTSAAVFRQRLFTPRYVTYRDLEQYDLPEYQQIGPDVTIELALGARALGSDVNFLRYKVSASWLFDFDGETYLRLKWLASGRHDGDEVVDNEVGFDLFGATPPLWGAVRVIAHAALSRQVDVEDNKDFIIGGDSGLRGYEVGAFRGSSFALGNLEVRTDHRKLWFMRVGGIAFWDLGHAAATLDDLVLHNDVGIGLRVLAPQTGESIYRFDWAIPFQGAGAGLPGRFSAGFYQAF